MRGDDDARAETFGRYFIGRTLGSGGMGEVSLARQTGPGGFARVCVIKRMHPSLASHQDQVALFLHEARLTAQLSHPHIAQLLDFGEVDGVYYLAIEWVDGPSLRQLLHWHHREGLQLPLPIACRLVSQVAQALDAAHAAKDPDGTAYRLVHRDISPSNVLVSVTGAAKLIDFGIAKSIESPLRTQAGMVRGKLLYMSPEHLEGQTLDGRADLYSLGLVLYELITGTVALSAVPERRLGVVSARLEIPPAAQLRPDAPPELLAVLERALELDLSRRWQTGAELAAALDAVVKGCGWSQAAEPAEVAALAARVHGEAPVREPTTESDRVGACPSEADLDLFSKGTLPSSGATRVRAHVDRCDACRQLVAALASEAPHVSSTNDLIGRYVVEASIGAGEMGQVFRARDPQLNRSVAIKLMLGGQQPGARARGLREGQAAAQVRHPNVVAVHDVGVHGDDLFIAMELVEGPTLREYLQRGPVPQAQLERLLAEVGLGLEAIHAAGLVHRDIKPENILVDAQGHPRVSDFGLVRDPSAELTWGRLVGTPAYMAPEQLKGWPATAASDQFSFCVVAYEALLGKRPFSGATFEQMRASASSGLIRAEWGSVSPPVRRVLSQGLAADPAERFESMAKLNAALADALKPPARPWLRLAVGLATLMLAVGGVVGWQQRRDRLRQEECHASRLLEPVWSEAAKARAAAAFEATGRTYSAAAWRDARLRMDAYGRAWVTARTEACFAALGLSGPEPLLRARTACLDRRLDEFAVLADVFATADLEVVNQASSAVERLSSLDGCKAPTPLPARALSVAETLDHGRLTHALASGQALLAAGRPATARVQLELASEVARRLKLPAEEALVLKALGDLERDSGSLEASRDNYQGAVRLAEGVSDDFTAALALTSLVSLVGWRLEQPAAARSIAAVAEGVVQRLGHPDRLEAAMAEALGDLEWQAGHSALSIGHYQRAIDAMLRSAGERSLDVARLRSSLGWVLNEQAQLHEARTQLQLALDTSSALVGPDHPSLVSIWKGLAAVASDLGDTPAAVQAAERGLAIVRQSNPGSVDSLFPLLGNLITYLVNDGRPQEAEKYLKEAEALLERSEPKLPSQAVAALVRRGVVESALGRHDTAEKSFRAALERGGPLGAKDLRVADALANLARELFVLGRLAESDAIFERYRAMARQAGIEANPNHASELVDHAATLTALGKLRAARTELEQATALLPLDGNPRRAATARFALAKALEAEGHQRTARVLELAREAAEAFRRANLEADALGVQTWAAKP